MPIDVAPPIYVSRTMGDRASKRYPSCYHLRSLVLLSEPEMENAVSPPPASLDTHSPYLRLRAEAGTRMCKEGKRCTLSEPPPLS